MEGVFKGNCRVRGQMRWWAIRIRKCLQHPSDSHRETCHTWKAFRFLGDRLLADSFPPASSLGGLGEPATLVSFRYAAPVRQERAVTQPGSTLGPHLQAGGTLLKPSTFVDPIASITFKYHTDFSLHPMRSSKGRPHILISQSITPLPDA